MRDSLLQSLKKAARADKVSLQFKDGSIVEGAILFNEIKKCGKIINIDDEISLDFDMKEVSKVKL
ncbi:MAG: hypothetical protein ACYTG7_10185 [Planctomycetota bacterium]|jgi:hypothetical protein